MANLASVLKEEIARLARKEIRLAVAPLQENLGKVKKTVSEQKKQILALEKELARMHFPRNTGKSLEKYKILKGSYDKALSKISTDTNVPIIDIESLFESPERREVFTDSMHFNKNGAEVIGSFVSDQILPQIK